MGACPAGGKHSVDIELMSMLTLHRDACIVVTRNSHVAEISTFLTAHGAPEELPIKTLKRPKSKAEYILANLDANDCVVFVDDAVAEVMDPKLAADTRIVRVLFVRAML